mmetsp:Transcript_46129/g.142705  ORF Transcript_46129/g.142705 Transcript_46129/m.142705 type:complete len:118 (+) Transcript_46129:349-702(+)
MLLLLLLPRRRLPPPGQERPEGQLRQGIRRVGEELPDLLQAGDLVEDLPIHDARSHADSADQCQERCARMQGCAFFTFWHDGGCHLHSENAHPKQAVGAIAGPKACPGQPLPSHGAA